MTTSNYLRAIAASGGSARPPAFANLIGWYEIRPDLVTVAGGVISQVNNRVAGGANPLVQPLSGSGQRPAYETTAWGGGKSSILFDGLTTFMTAHGLAASVTGNDAPFTIVAVMQIVTIGVVSGNNRAFWCFGNSGTDTPFCASTILDGTTDGALSRRDDAGSLKQRAQATALSTSRVTRTMIFTGTRAKLRTNGAADVNLDGVTSPSADVDVGTAAFNQFSVGCAARSGVAWLTNFRLGGMLVYTGALSDANALSAESYLRIMHPL